MSDILLINLWNSLKYFGNYKVHENLGLEYIDNYLRMNGIVCDIYDPHIYNFSVQPQFHWTVSKVRVHTFCCLLGLLLTSILKKELSDSGIKMENKKIIDTLSGIREVYVLTPDKKSKNDFSVEKKLEQMSPI